MVDWDLLRDPNHAKLFGYFKDLNSYFSKNPAFNIRNLRGSPVNHFDNANKVISFWRTDPVSKKKVLAVVNLGDSHAGEGGVSNYRIGLPEGGKYRLALDSESARYGGDSKLGNRKQFVTEGQGEHGKAQSLVIDKLSPYQVLIFENVGGAF